MLDLDAKRRTRVEPEAPVIATVAPIITAAIAGEGMKAALAQVALMLLMSFIIQQTTPKPEKAENAFQPEGNTVGVGEPVPLVYGTHKTYGHVLQNYVFKDDHDSQWARVLYAVSEGEVKAIRDIKVNDIPYENYNPTGNGKVMIFTNNRTGTHTQGPIGDWFGSVQNSQPVGVTIDDGMDAKWTTTASDLTDFQVTLTFPNGLVFMKQPGFLESGGPRENNVGMRVQFREAGSPTWSTPKYFRYAEKKQVRFFRTIKASTQLNQTADPEGAKLNPAGAQYEIWVHRMTEAEFNALWHIDGTDNEGNPTIDYYRQTRGDQSQATTIVDFCDEINSNNHPSYADTALLAMSMRASNVLSGGYPRVSCVVDGIKIRSRVNGVWQAKAWSDNPAWVIYDLLTSNRYGLGAYIKESDIDVDSFEDFAKYCDQEVDVLATDGVTVARKEKRHRCNIVLDQREPAWDVIRKLLASFRALLVESDGKYRLVIENAEDVSQMFTMGNIVSGSFQTHWANLKEEYNVVEISFEDEEADWDKSTVRYTTNQDNPLDLPADEDAKVCQVQLAGITSASQAHREANYRLNMITRLSQSVEFDAALDAITCRVGDVIAVSHDVPQWGFSGRLKAMTSTTLTLDRTGIPFEAGKNYEVTLRYPDDTIPTPLTVTGVNGAVVTVSGTVPATTELPRDVLYSYGEVAKSVKKFRVMSISLNEDLTRHVTAAEYDDAVYTETPYSLPEATIVSALPTPFALNSATGLTVLTHQLATADHRTLLSQEVRWTPPSDGYNRGKVWLRMAYDSTWDFAGEGFDTLALYLSPGSYEVAVCSVNTIGVEEDPDNVATVAFIVEAKQGTLPIVVPESPLGGPELVHLSWKPVEAVDLAGYEVYMGTASSFVPDTATCADRVWTGLATKCDIALAPSDGDRYFKVRAIDNYGLASADFATVGPIHSNTVQVDLPNNTPATPAAAPTLSSSIYKENCYITASFSALTDAVQYEVRIGEGSAPSTYQTTTTAALSVVFGPLKVGVQYQVSYRGLNGLGTPGTWSDARSLTVTAGASNDKPAAPSGVTVTPAYASLVVAWTAPADMSKVARFEVHASSDSAFTPAIGTRKWAGVAAMAPVDLGVGWTGYIKVVAVSYNGIMSDAVTASGNPSYSTAKIGTTDISDNAVTADKIVSGSITADHIVATGLDAAVIQSGTIDATVVSVVNLSADNITTGTLNADEISISAGANAVQLGATGLKGYDGAKETFSLGVDGKVAITSADGKTAFDGNTWTISDENGVVRVKLGKLV